MVAMNEISAEQFMVVQGASGVDSLEKGPKP